MFNRKVEINEEGFIDWNHPVLHDWLFHANLSLQIKDINKKLVLKSKVVKTRFTKLSVFLYNIGFRTVPCKIQHQIFLKEHYSTGSFPIHASTDVDEVIKFIITFHRNEVRGRAKNA